MWSNDYLEVSSIYFDFEFMDLEYDMLDKEQVPSVSRIRSMSRYRSRGMDRITNLAPFKVLYVNYYEIPPGAELFFKLYHSVQGIKIVYLKLFTKTLLKT